MTPDAANPGGKTTRGSNALPKASDVTVRLMVDAIPQLAWIHDPSGRIEFVNRRWEAYTGVAIADAPAADVALQVVHPDDVPAVMQRLHASLESGTTFTSEHRMRARDGTYRWFVAQAEPYRDPVRGRIVHWFGTHTDIHERRTAEEALRQSEAKYRALFHSIDEGFCILEMIFDEHDTPRDYRFLEVNPTFEEHTGLRDAVGRTALELVPELEASWFERYGRVALTGDSVRFEEHAPAMRRWFDVFAFRIGDPEERRVAVLFKDVSRRRRVEAALRDSERRLRTMADTAPAMIWVTDTNNACTFLSRGWFEHTGQTEDEALGFGWLDAVHPDDRPSSERAFLDSAASREPFSLEHRLRCNDGDYRWVIDAGRPRFDTDGTFLGYIGSVIDIHEQKIATDALRKLELERRLHDHLEAERQRIGRELHDTVRQQLAGMRMLTVQLERQLRDAAPAQSRLLQEFADLLTDANLQVRELIAGLMPTRVNARDLPAALEREARNVERWYGVHCSSSVIDRIPLAEDEVADHLFFIGREALTNAAKHARGTSIEVTLGIQSGVLVLRVRDDGIGIAPGDADAGGFGFRNLRHRAELIGARLDIESGHGTVVTCILPLDQAATNP